MVLSRNSIWVRYYAFLLRIAGNERFVIDDRLSRVSDLCQFTRALFFRSIAVVVICGILLFLIAGLALSIYTEPVASLIVIGVIVGIAMMVIGVVFWSYKITSYFKGRPDGVVTTYVKAVKRGICPMLRIEPR